MTYNFDPDGWLERQRRLLEQLRDRGEIDADEFDRRDRELERRYDEMLARLERSYEIPPS